MLSKVLDEIKNNRRICLQPVKWNDFYQLLRENTPEELRDEIPLPLILSAWWYTPILPKIMRFEEHIRWAEDHGFLQVVFDYLDDLPETDWFHGDD